MRTGSRKLRNRGVANRPDEAAPDDRGSDQSGSTLPEVLLALFILSSAVIVMVAGMATLLSSSTQNRESTTAGVVARDYAEALVLAVAVPNAWCSSSYTVAYTAPTGFPVSSVLGACPANNSTTPQFQTVTITAGSPDGGSELLRVVVRAP